MVAVVNDAGAALGPPSLRRRRAQQLPAVAGSEIYQSYLYRPALIGKSVADAYSVAVAAADAAASCAYNLLGVVRL